MHVEHAARAVWNDEELPSATCRPINIDLQRKTYTAVPCMLAG